MRLGNLLTKWRLFNDMPIRGLAQEIGIGSATLMRIEHGYDPDVKTFKKILLWLMEDQGKRGATSQRRAYALSKESKTPEAR